MKIKEEVQRHNAESRRVLYRMHDVLTRNRDEFYEHSKKAVDYINRPTFSNVDKPEEMPKKVDVRLKEHLNGTMYFE